MAIQLPVIAISIYYSEHHLSFSKWLLIGLCLVQSQRQIIPSQPKS